MIANSPGKTGRFRTAQTVLGSEVRKRPGFLKWMIYLELRDYAVHSPLRGMPKMPDPIRGCLQLISQWVLSYTYCAGVLGRVSALLFVLPPARFQSMEFERDENLCRFKSCPSSRLRHTGRNSAAYGNSRQWLVVRKRPGLSTCSGRDHERPSDCCWHR